MAEWFISGTNMVFSILGIAAISSVFAIISNNSIDRIPRNQSIIKPEPYCRSCATAFTWKDQIPIISYLIHKCKCPYCGAKIPTRNFFIEVGEFAWVSIFVLKFGWSYEALIVLLFGISLIAIIAIEYENRVMSDLILLIMLMLSVIFLLAYRQSEFPNALLGMTIGAGVMAVYNFMKIAGKTVVRFDYSEIKLGAVLGLFFGGFGIILCIFLAWFIGAILGSVKIKFFKKDHRDAIPEFPTILAIAGIITVLFNTELTHFYMALMR